MNSYHAIGLSCIISTTSDSDVSFPSWLGIQIWIQFLIKSKHLACGPERLGVQNWIWVMIRTCTWYADLSG